MWSLSPHPNSSTPLRSSSSTHHAPLGSAPAPTCGACHRIPIHLHPWGLVPVPLGSAPAPKYRACHSTPMHSHPWSLALAPLGSSSSTSHTALGLALAPFRTLGYHSSTFIHLVGKVGYSCSTLFFLQCTRVVGSNTHKALTG